MTRRKVPPEHRPLSSGVLAVPEAMQPRPDYTNRGIEYRVAEVYADIPAGELVLEIGGKKCRVEFTHGRVGQPLSELGREIERMLNR